MAKETDAHGRPIVRKDDTPPPEPERPKPPTIKEFLFGKGDK